ncbi:tyrosine-type recombinase/integrase [Lacticaseibacillus songhuajiangensis]|jgi:integrase|uniref:tyrosine-type recombinase/integrase n=1 Tax=Lacticaseibacillus songhuajiangensis TaxID=1296539 RepID=UPI000F7AAF23|nr:tyrosine-type recombinase/integrase [Lacticaseibacillus songhuajiangensis]
MATIRQYQTKDGRKLWEFNIYVGRDELTNKRQYVHRQGFESKKAATLAASRTTLDANQSGRHINTARMTFRQVYEEWDAGYKNTVRESTYYKTSCAIKVNLLPNLGDRRLTELTPRILQHQVKEWATKSSIAYKAWVSVLKRIFKYAHRCGYINNDPAALLTIPKSKLAKPHDIPNFWTREELAQFLGAIDAERYPEQLAFFRVLAFAGLRRGEACALTWGDISFSDNTIDVNKTASRGNKGRIIINPPKTKAGNRTLAMDAPTMRILNHWRVTQIAYCLSRGWNANTPDQLVFPSSANTVLTQYTPERWLASFTAVAKMAHPIRLHGFRHSHASLLFAAGASIKEVQVRLGHDDAQTTMNIYAHVTPNQSEQAAEKLAAYMNF